MFNAVVNCQYQTKAIIHTVNMRSFGSTFCDVISSLAIFQYRLIINNHNFNIIYFQLSSAVIKRVPKAGTKYQAKTQHNTPDHNMQNNTLTHTHTHHTNMYNGYGGGCALGS